MPYATVDEYVSFVGQEEAIEVSNLDNPAAVSSVTEAVLTRALEDASSEIEGILGIRYDAATLRALSPAPKTLRDTACAIARKNLDKLVRRELVQKDYEAAIARLQRIAQGKEALLDSNGNPVVTPSTEAVAQGRVSFGYGTQAFTRESLSGYRQGWTYR